MYSCIIPTQNRCSLITRAIDSVLAQNDEHIEIIVVDDASTDGTPQVVNQLYPFVKVVQTNGVGPGLARNQGVKAARSDILMFLDSDDEWLPHHATQLAEQLENGYQVAYGITHTVNQVQGGSFFIPEDGKGQTGDCFKSLIKWCFMVPSAFGLTRRAFEDVGGFEESSFGEDWLFFLKLSMRYKFAFVASEITRRYLHKNSLCSMPILGDQILKLYQKLEKMLLSSKKADQNDFDFIEKVKGIVVKENTQWKTVQDLYGALKRHKVV